MKDLQIGVIGSASRGTLAMQAHKPNAHSRVVACCDLDAAVLESNRRDYGDDIFTTHDYRELLQRPLDAVFVTTPDFWHEEHAVAALRAGIAVYLEKPMAITIDGCDRILRAAYESKSRLYVGHNMRHMAFVLKMKELIDGGAIGQVKAIWCRHFVGHGGDYYFKDWHAERRYSTGLLLQKGAHDIDIIHWLAGSHSELVNALGGLTLYGDITDRLAPIEGAPLRQTPPERGPEWPPQSSRFLNAEIDVEDLSMMQMRLKNGVFASYQQCHYTPDYWRNYTVIGTHGRLENFADGEDGTQIKVWNNRVNGYNGAADQVHNLPIVVGGHGGADPRIVGEFLRFVREGGRTTTSPLAARHSVAAGCAATQSLRTGGQPCVVPEIDAELVDYFSQFAL